MQSLLVGTNRNVSNLSTSQQSEMQVAINPKNPLNLIAISHSISGTTMMDTWYSVNGGHTWTNTPVNEGIPFVYHRFDPTVAFDPNGNAYIAYGANHANIGGPDTKEVVVARSTNGGISHGSHTIVESGNLDPMGLDKWLLAADPRPSATGGEKVYLGYNDDEESPPAKLAVSNNGGSSFPTGLIENISGSSGSFATPTVDSDGRLYLAWDTKAGQLKMVTSDDGGTNFSGVHTVAQDSLNTAGGRRLSPAQPNRGIRAAPSVAVGVVPETAPKRIYAWPGRSLSIHCPSPELPRPRRASST
jgi:hypothetical protein